MRKQTIRLAFRVEGNFWNAYVARLDTMEDAVLLGSLTMRLAAIPELKSAFMDLMKDGLATMVIKDIDAEVVRWNDPVDAPEHERAGRA